MAYQDLALPIDIPWKRLAASSDMIDEQYGDRKFPPKWKSSLSIFYHEPDDLPETYCDRKITYLKIVCSITGYQPGKEVGIEVPLTDDRLKEDKAALGEAYYPCLGALLQVAVFPKTKDGKAVPLSDFPYIIDFEPKRRELFEAVTQSAEILGRSASTLNVRKGATTTETTELAAKIGTEVQATIGVATGKVSAEASAKKGTGIEVSNIRTTDDSREKRETYSSSTSLTQMYELFTGYHLGTNRAVFFMVPRPHTVDRKDDTFVNGPRRLEGIQEVFLVVNRPKHIPGICFEAYLETAHLKPEKVEKTTNNLPSGPEFMQGELRKTLGPSRWEDKDNDKEAQLDDDHRQWEFTVGTLGDGCKIDTSRGGGSIEVWWELNGWKTKTIYIPKGYAIDVKEDYANIYYSEYPEVKIPSLDDIQPTVDGNTVNVTVTIHKTYRGWGAERDKFQFDFIVYTLCPKQAPIGDTTNNTQQAQTQELYLTARGLSTCIDLTGKETTIPSQTRTRPLDWQKVLPDRIPPYIDRELFDPTDFENPEKFKKKVKELIDKGSIDPVPPEWLLPAEWVSFETKILVPSWMANPTASANDRIRAANDLTERVGRIMIESLGSNKRYRNQTVDFWQTKLVLDHLSKSLADMPDDDAANVPINDLVLANRDIKARMISKFGENVRRKEVLSMSVEDIQKRLKITETEAKELKLNLLALPRRSAK